MRFFFSVAVITYACQLGVAVQIARSFRLLKDGQSATLITDEEIREILTTGEVYLFSVADSSLGLQQLIVTILEERRMALEANLRWASK